MLGSLVQSVASAATSLVGDILIGYRSHTNTTKMGIAPPQYSNWPPGSHTHIDNAPTSLPLLIILYMCHLLVLSSF